MTLFYDEKAEQLAEETMLSQKEAELYVLKTRNGYTLDEAAEEMDLGKGNIYGKWGRVKNKISRAQKTAELSTDLDTRNGDS